MSIADKITQLTNIRAAIRTALQNKGIAAAASHNFADFAADIAAIVSGATLQSKSVSPSTSQQVVTPDSGYDGLSQVTVAGAPLQTRTVTPTAAGLQVEKSSSSWYGLFRVNVNGDTNLVAGNIKSGVTIFGVTGNYAPASVVTQEKSVTPTAAQQVVTPDSGKLLSKVTVAATPLETRAVTPSASAQTITPSSGKVGISQVNVAAAPLETKTVTPTAADQIISPSSGKIGMSQVTVKAAPLQTKTVTPSGSQQVITPGSGYVGMSKVTVKAAVLQAKSVTPSSSQQVITPDSGKYGLSQVTVAAVTPIAVTGALVIATIGSNVTRVVGSIGGYTADADISDTTAYMIVPATYISGTLTLTAYQGSTAVMTATVSITAIDKYTVSLVASAVLYENGDWNNYSPSFIQGDNVAISEDATRLRLIAQRTITTGNIEYIIMTPAVSPSGYSKIKFTIYSVNSTYHASFGVSASSTSMPSALYEIDSAGTFTYTIPSNLRGRSIYFWFALNGRAGYNTVLCLISKIEFE